MAERIHVTAPGGDYDILIESGILKNLTAYAGAWGKSIIVTNTTIAPLHGESLAASLPKAKLAVVPDGEQYKTLETIAQLYADFIAAGLDRGSTVIALGGGVVGDMAGFAAATYMRGVRFVQIPTTLLSMVDSSVGGKVGVDLPQGKNLVGSFKQPDMVLIDPDILKTLPAREWRCGMAEVIKHGFLADELILDMVAKNPSLNPSPFHGEGLENKTKNAAELIRRAVQVKVDVVQRDPFEKGERAHLNLGHTFGHAVEQATHYQWPHGEAVGLGLLAAARLSSALNLCDSTIPERMEDILAHIGLPRRLNGIDPKAIYAAMATDKKWLGGHSRFVLLRGVGQPVIVKDVPKETIIQILSDLQ
jgi:3-dehydroquinate synthase